MGYPASNFTEALGWANETRSPSSTSVQCRRSPIATSCWVLSTAYAYVRDSIVTSWPFSVHSISPGTAVPGYPRTVTGRSVTPSGGCHRAPGDWVIQIDLSYPSSVVWSCTHPAVAPVTLSTRNG